MIFRGDKTRMSWEYFLRSIAEASDKLEQWLTDIRFIRLHGIPEIIRCEDTSELKERKFNEICSKHRIKQEFTSADRPQLNSVAERGLTPVDERAKAFDFQARVSFKDITDFTNKPSLTPCPIAMYSA